ncbi:SIS domain-containing protein [Parabacteroides sp. Marseille-P3160]|uniref:D-sedoheptulose-7-phosphate isomerase n=1 Tax=Parabacteroides sp. Marseille-P3160 TaxID=1917887 RepID=UPI0009BBB768|nr:D-sedoheptulose 7-phosphate isomerase [Parabacteroides sp. Marseille-P3160]
MIDFIQQKVQASIDVKQHILQQPELLGRIEQATELVATAFRSGGKVFFCGNGGSAADAQHLAAEFSGKFYLDRKGLPAEALHCNTSYLTAVSNDYSYEIAYARLIDGIGKAGDVLIGLSTSGNSKNILLAFEKARSMGISTIGFTGKGGGKMRELSDVLLNVPSEDTPRIQESHILIGHILCEIVERNLFA